MIFDEKDVRRFYRWLGHRPDEFTEIRVITWPPGQATPYFVQNEDDFVKRCKEWNGKRQVYTGINPRKREGGTAEDVVRVTGIPFDVDSDHDPEVACTDQELEKAKERCIQLNSLLITRGYKTPYIDMSGNGYRVALKVDMPITENLSKKLETFFHEINNALPFTMDSIFDISRIIKVPGTMSIKGIPTEERPHRLSQILSLGQDYDKPDEELKKYILGLENYTPPIISAPVSTTRGSRTVRTTSRLRPCFDRFAKEGGRLSTNNFNENPVTENELRREDHLLRLALVIEASSINYSRDKIVSLFENSDDWNKKTTTQQVNNELGKIATEGLKPWRCETILKHHGCFYGQEKCRYKEKTKKQEIKISIADTGYSIVSSKRKKGFILVDKNDKAISEIENTKKYRKKTAKDIKISIDDLNSAIAEANLIPFSETGEDKRNPGAVIFQLVREFSNIVFKDQLGETYVTFIEEIDVSDTSDTRFPIVNLTASGDIFGTHKKTLKATQFNNREVSVTSVTKSSINSHNPNKNPVSSQNFIKIFRTMRIRGREFKQWAASLYYNETEKASSSESIKSAILVLEAEATEMRYMFNRIAPDGEDGVWWDMSDKYGRAIHITKDGWSIVTNPPQIFKRYPHQLPLVEPAEVGSLTPLLDYIILEDPLDQLLNVVTPITYLIPEVPHIIEFLGGPQGVTKSTNHRFRRMVVDPSSVPLLSMPKDLEQMIQHGDHHYLLMYDNVSAVDDEQSDLMCRMCTGLGFSKRMLYTDDDTVIRQYLRCININGINLSGEKSDLLNRAVIQTATLLEDKNRRTEKEMKKQMVEDAPKVIRGFLDVLVRAMKFYDTVKPKRNNRMADFTRWGCAITQAMGIDYRFFELAYAKNIATQNEEAVKSSPVADWLVRWFDYSNFKSGYEGSASELLGAILVYAKNLHDRDLNWVDGWPKGATPFGKKLKMVIPNLKAIGYEIRYGRVGASRKYIIRKIVSDDADKTTAGQRTLFFGKTKNDWLTTQNLRDKLIIIDTLDSEGKPIIEVEAVSLSDEVDDSSLVVEEPLMVEEKKEEVSDSPKKSEVALPTEIVENDKTSPFSKKFSSIKKPKNLKELLEVLETHFGDKIFEKDAFIEATIVAMGCTKEIAVKLWDLASNKEADYFVEVNKGEFRYKEKSEIVKETSSGTLSGWEKDILDRAEQVFTRDTTELGNLLFEKYIRERFGVEEPLGKIIEILQKDPEKRFIVGKRTIGIRKGEEPENS